MFVAFCVSCHPFILFHLAEPDTYKNRGDLDSEVGIRKACRFSRNSLEICSGIEDPYFGFQDGKPCLIVKLNRIVNFKPKVGLLDLHNVTNILVYKIVKTNCRYSKDSYP